MRWMRHMGLGEISTPGALLIGAAIGVAGIPAVKKIARGLAVTAVSAVMGMNDMVKGVGGNASNEWKKILEDARSGNNDKQIRDHLHEAGVGIAGAGMAAVEKTKEKISNLKSDLSHVKNDLMEVSENMRDDVREAENHMPNNHQNDRDDL